MVPTNVPGDRVVTIQHSPLRVYLVLIDGSTMTSYGHRLPYLLLYTLPPIALTLIIHPLLPLLLPASVLSLVPLPPHPEFPALQANVGFALLAFVGSVLAVPYVGKAFTEKGLQGRDLLKPGGRTDGPWV